MPADGVRDVPDVSIDASPDVDGYLICSGGSCVVGWRATAGGNLNVIGGTSMGVPTFAGVVALINQEAGTAQGQGNINYILYPLATSFPSAFHDITAGNNMVPCQSGSTGCPSTGTNAGFIGYPATTGYDLATGLGSIDAFNLVTAWTSVSSSSILSSSGSSGDFQLVASPPKLTLAPSSSASTVVTLLPMNGFAVSGTPSFSCSVATNLVGVTCTVTAATAPNTWTVAIVAAANAALRAPAGVAGYGDGEGARRFQRRLAPILLLAGILLSLVAGAVYAGNEQLQPWHMGAPASLSLRRNHGKLWKLVPVSGLALLCFVALTIGCGSSSNSSSTTATGNGSTAAAAGMVNIQGSANGVSHTVQIGVTVN